MTAGRVAAEGPGDCVVVTTCFPAGPGDPSGHFVDADVRRRRERGQRVIVLAPRTSHATAPDPDLRLLPAGDAFGWPGALARLRERPAPEGGRNEIRGPIGRLIDAQESEPLFLPVILARRGQP